MVNNGNLNKFEQNLSYRFKTEFFKEICGHINRSTAILGKSLHINDNDCVLYKTVMKYISISIFLNYLCIIIPYRHPNYT